MFFIIDTKSSNCKFSFIKYACPILWSLSNKNSILSFIVLSNFDTFIPSTLVGSIFSFGIYSIKSNLLLSAVSKRAIDLSAVFIVPIMYKLLGTPK